MKGSLQESVILLILLNKIKKKNNISKYYSKFDDRHVINLQYITRYNVTLAPDGPPVCRDPQAVLKAENGIWLTLAKREI